MSVVSPPSTNESSGNVNAGSSTTLLSALQWSTSNISVNTIQYSNLYPPITSTTSRGFSWFQGKSFRVMYVIGCWNYIAGSFGGGSAAIVYPLTTSGNGYSIRYDTYSYVTLTCVPTYPNSFYGWSLGTSGAPNYTYVGYSTLLNLAATDLTSTSNFYIWAVLNAF